MPLKRCPCHGELWQVGPEYNRHVRNSRGPQASGRLGSTRQWRKLREQVIRRDGGCKVCGATSRLEVHHIQSKASGGADTMDNLVTLCFMHHDRRA